MRKLILLLFLIPLLSVFMKSHAQSNWEAGVRVGDGFALDVTIPFKAPRIHAAAYFNNDFGLGAYFDWMYALSNGPKGLKFYPGLGPEVYFGDDFDFGIAGDFGAEYSFDFPLTVGLDWRPIFEFTEADFKTGNWGIFARFRFGEGVSFTRTR
jgi:hypothetical protein